MIKLELRSIKNLEVLKSIKMTVLDVPCGTGVSFDLLSKFKCKVTGVDISTEMLGLLKLRQIRI